MPSTSLYDWFYPSTDGEDYPFDEHTKIVQDIENLFKYSAELFGSGFFTSADMNASAVAGQLKLSMSGKNAWVGAVGNRKLVHQESPTEIGTAQGITASATNYIWLKSDGTYLANTSGSNPGNAELAATAVFDATQSTSQNNNPTGRNNLASVLSMFVEILAARGSLASVDARLDVILNNDGTLKAAVVGTANLSFDPATQAELDAHAAAADPHTVYQKESERNAAGGYAGLDGGGLLARAQQTVGPDQVYRGAGSPEGVTTAGVGSVYLDTTAGALWVKVTGAGNTGWKLTPRQDAATKTAAYTVTVADDLIEADTTTAGFTVTLPAVASVPKGFEVTVKKISSDANSVTVDGSAAETIDGAADKVWSTQWQSYTFKSNGSAWRLV